MAYYQEQRLGSAVAAAVVGIVSLAVQGGVALTKHLQALKTQRALESSAAEIARIDAEIARTETAIREQAAIVEAEKQRQDRTKWITGGAIGLAVIVALGIAFKP